MSRLRHGAIGVLLIVAGALIVVPGRATAETEFVHDRSHDVVRGWWTGCAPSGEGCAEHSGADRSNEVADIVWSRHTFTKHRLTLRLKLRRVSMRRHVPTYAGWDIRGRHGDLLSAQLMYDHGTKNVDIGSYTVDDFRCPDAEATVKRRTGVFTLRIPRSCVGSAGWVRVATSVMVEDFDSARGTSWYDDPLAGRHLRIHDSVAERHFGPRLYRD